MSPETNSNPDRFSDDLLQHGAETIEAAMDLSEEEYLGTEDAQSIEDFSTNLPTRQKETSSSEERDRNRALRDEVNPFALEVLSEMFGENVTDAAQLETFEQIAANQLRRPGSQTHTILGDAMVLARGGDTEGTKEKLVEMYEEIEVAYQRKIGQGGIEGHSVTDAAEVAAPREQVQQRMRQAAAGGDEGRVKDKAYWDKFFGKGGGPRGTGNETIWQPDDTVRDPYYHKKKGGEIDTRRDKN